MPVKATDQITSLRVPKTIYEFFKELAAKNDHSVNTEIVVALREKKERIEKEQSTLTPPSS